LSSPGKGGTCNGCICSGFRWIWLIRRKAVDLLSRSQFLLRNWRSILHGNAGARCCKYWVRILYLRLLKARYFYRKAAFIRAIASRNASLSRDLLARRSDAGSAGASCTGFAQAVDGFAFRFPMLCKLENYIILTLFWGWPI